jgi:hypothetical protein
MQSKASFFIKLKELKFLFIRAGTPFSEQRFPKKEGETAEEEEKKDSSGCVYVCVTVIALI